MDLQNFIRETLVQVTNGMLEAGEILKPTGTLVNPRYVDRRHPNNEYVGDLIEEDGAVDLKYIRRPVHRIEFDVAVHATEETSKAGGAGLHIGVVMAGGKGGDRQSNASESRIKFSIPIVYPSATQKAENK